MLIIDIFIVTYSLNLSLAYSFAPSLACSVSVLHHETNRGYNCWWASLCVILIIPSREPHRCSALKVQKLQRPALTEPLWNNKLNGAHNKREGSMHPCQLSSPERGLMRACRLNPTTLSPFPDRLPPSVSPVAPSTANWILLVSLNFSSAVATLAILTCLDCLDRNWHGSQEVDQVGSAGLGFSFVIV